MPVPFNTMHSVVVANVNLAVIKIAQLSNAKWIQAVMIP